MCRNTLEEGSARSRDIYLIVQDSHKRQTALLAFPKSQRARSSHYRSFTITLRHTTLVTSPLDEGSARHRYLYLTTHDIRNRNTSMTSTVFEPIMKCEPYIRKIPTICQNNCIVLRTVCVYCVAVCIVCM